MSDQIQTIAPAPLRAQLDATAQHLATVLPADANQTIDAGIEAVEQSGVAQQTLKPGDPAPNFTLPDSKGQSVSLTELLKNGPVVLTFYRGNWCPYCNVQLRAYQQALPDFDRYGATLVAISPQTPDHTTRTANEKELQFPVLSDVGNSVARQYGLVYAVGDAVYGTLNSVGIDLETYNGDASGELPLTVTFVIGTDGLIAWADVYANFKYRSEPSAILDALDKLDNGASGQPLKSIKI